MNEQHDDRPLARGATLDWAWDWSDWMAAGDSIQTRTITPSAEITAGEPLVTGAKVTAMLTCADDAPIGSRQSAACRITTTNGRADARTIRFVITAR